MKDDTTTDFSNLSLVQWIAQSAVMEPNQAAEMIIYATSAYDQNQWKEKTNHLFALLPSDSKSTIEIFAKALSADQLIEIIQFIKHSHDNLTNRQKLSSIIAHASPLVFCDVIFQASKDVLSFLSEEAVTETVQHLISMISNDLNHDFSTFCEHLTAEEERIAHLDLTTQNQIEMANLYETLEHLRLQAKSMLHFLKQILTIAWNTTRQDLIQDLGRTKELCQKCLIENIGHPAENDSASTGLWALVEQNVSKIFSDTTQNGQTIFMKDSTPALEALVKFSIWNLQDYYELGLIPEITSAESENDNLKYREKIFIEVEKNLSKMGLRTLADLKASQIYSKKALMEYISTFQNQLTD